MSLARCFTDVKFFFRLKKNRKLKAVFCWLIALVLVFKLLLGWNNNPVAIKSQFIYLEPITSYFRFKHSFDVKDWHDYKAIEKDLLRTGLGEQGEAVYLNEDEEEFSQKVFEENQHNGLVSDKIARDRAIPDTRPDQCKKRTYLSDLPSVSVVIPFHNEVLSTLTRTIHSVINRSPPELLKEVILVNDHSDKEHLYGQLEDYINENFDTQKIKLIVMPSRSGLIWARLAGARAARGDVLVFMDCHIEVNVNWLPPLLEPIAKNYRTCACPLIDVVDFSNYMYSKSDGSRGVFSWKNFNYQFLLLRSGDQASEDQPFKSPVMMGCAFAISAKFFWELGGYDTGLDIWGGEQYELSFKIWLCGGEQLDIPCSRIGHLYRERPFVEVANRTGEYWNNNFKRVAEVWMDEYKQYVYDKDPEKWEKVSAGDLTYMLKLKQKLNCKPFKYFIEEVAPDMLERFPLVDPPSFASGGIQSVSNPNLCIDIMEYKRDTRIGVEECEENLQKPSWRQFFRLRNYRDIFIDASDVDCVDRFNDQLIFYGCKFDTKQIFCERKRDNSCIDMDPSSKTLFVGACDQNKTTQQWNWGFVNETMLRNWAKFGNTILDPDERSDFESL